MDYDFAISALKLDLTTLHMRLYEKRKDKTLSIDDFEETLRLIRGLKKKLWTLQNNINLKVNKNFFSEMHGWS